MAHRHLPAAQLEDPARDGQVVPPDVGCVKHFATKVDNGEVFLAL
jgi:nitrite reductase/ring-hydroxylating ferredoxin subunit